MIAERFRGNLGELWAQSNVMFKRISGELVYIIVSFFLIEKGSIQEPSGTIAFFFVEFSRIPACHAKRGRGVGSGRMSNDMPIP